MSSNNMDRIPFPSVDGTPERVESPHKKAPSSSVPDMQETSSSKITSSDKLSALPNASVTPNRIPRTSYFAFQSSPSHYRHSFDASTSLPAFPVSKDFGATSNDLLGTMPTLPRSKNSSPGKDTPPQRISFDSDRGSQPTMRSVGQAFSHLARGSDQHRNSPRVAETPLQQSRSPSPSRSRAASPLRIFQQWSSGMHRTGGHRSAVEEPFVPINPFKANHNLKTHFRFCISIPDVEAATDSVGSSSGPYECDDILPKSFFSDAQVFFTDTMPRQLYLNFLLRLPAMYFSRVARIFQDAEVSRPDIQRMIDATCRENNAPNQEPAQPNAHVLLSPYPPQGLGAFSSGAASAIGLSAQVGAAPASVVHMPLPFPDEWTPALVSPSLIRFKHSWEAFIDSLLREWKTLNVVSALLASAILTIFQVPQAAEDPVTRTAALLSLICALMSLSYGCMYIVRFGTMRSMFRASKWAEEARKTNTLIWWNVWVLLAMPAVWMAWSMLLFLTAILSFVWRTGSEWDPSERPPMHAKAALGTRIAITVIFTLGLVYLTMIIKTLKRYGGSQGGGMKGILHAGMSGRTSVGMDGGGGGGCTTPAAAHQDERPIDDDVRRTSHEGRGRERIRRKSDPERRGDEGSPGVRVRKEALVRDEFSLKEKGMLGELLGLGLVGVNSRTDSGVGLEPKRREG